MDHSFLYSKKLLLVDDEPELLNMVTAILADEGFGHLVTAANMKDGVAAVQSEKPDLAILDVMLPDGDGFSLMEQIRAWTDIPVIFLTARDEAADKLAGLGLGADDYIAKPFLPQEFLLRVYAVLRRCYKEDAAVLNLDHCKMILRPSTDSRHSAILSSPMPCARSRSMRFSSSLAVMIFTSFRVPFHFVVDCPVDKAYLPM